MYRKCYLASLIWFVAMLFASILTAPFCAMIAKYSVISRFAMILNAKDDEFLHAQGGVNKFAIWIYVIFILAFLFVAYSAYMGYISYIMQIRY